MKRSNIIGLILLSVGVLLLYGTLLYRVAKSMLMNSDIPTIIILGIVYLILGVTIILISLIVERVKDKKRED